MLQLLSSPSSKVRITIDYVETKPHFAAARSFCLLQGGRCIWEHTRRPHPSAELASVHQSFTVAELVQRTRSTRSRQFFFSDFVPTVRTSRDVRGVDSRPPQPPLWSRRVASVTMAAAAYLCFLVGSSFRRRRTGLSFVRCVIHTSDWSFCLRRQLAALLCCWSCCCCCWKWW